MAKGDRDRFHRKRRLPTDSERRERHPLSLRIPRYSRTLAHGGDLMFLNLTQQEFRLASYAGIDRFARALFGGRKNNYGLGHNAFDAHVIGAYGEIAVARATDHYWMPDRGKPDHGAPDVGP